MTEKTKVGIATHYELRERALQIARGNVVDGRVNPKSGSRRWSPLRKSYRNRTESC